MNWQPVIAIPVRQKKQSYLIVAILLNCIKTLWLLFLDQIRKETNNEKQKKLYRDN